MNNKKSDFLDMYCTGRIVKKDRLASELEFQMLSYMAKFKPETQKKENF